MWLLHEREHEAHQLLLGLQLNDVYSLIADTQEFRQMLEEEPKLETKETVLMSIAVLGLHAQRPSAQLLALVVLVGCLDHCKPSIRSCAAELLLGEHHIL